MSENADNFNLETKDGFNPFILGGQRATLRLTHLIKVGSERAYKSVRGSTLELPPPTATSLSSPCRSCSPPAPPTCARPSPASGSPTRWPAAAPASPKSSPKSNRRKNHEEIGGFWRQRALSIFS